MQNPLISIIVPVYNVEKNLAECLESIINQSYTNIEIILIDDGSTDQSGAICDCYAKKDTRIKLTHQDNMGLSAVKNAGIAKSAGEYIMFVDSDDYISHDMCEKLINAGLENNCDMAVCRFQFVDDNHNQIEHLFGVCREIPDRILSGKEFITSLCNNYNVVYVVSWNKIYRKNILQNIKYEEGKFQEDELIIHHLADKCERIVFIPDICYFYRQRSDSIMNKQHNLGKLDNTIGFLDRLEFIKSRGYEQDTIFRLEKEIISDFIRTLRSLNKNDKTHIAEIKKFHKKLKPLSKHLITWQETPKDFKLVLRIFNISPFIFFYWK